MACPRRTPGAVLRCFLLLTGLVAVHSLPAFSERANSPHSLTNEMYHSAWTTKDGAPRGITSLAQTRDGYLWIGTTLGLYRFDGTTFTPYPSATTDPDLPSHDITSIAASDDGGLWVGYSHRGLSHLFHHTVVNYPLPEKYKGADVTHVFCCAEGSVWALVGDAILRLQGRDWADFGSLHGLPTAAFFTLFFDKQGNIWTASRHSVYVLKRDATRFDLIKQRVFSVTQFVQSKDGAIWISDGWRGIRPLFSENTKPQVVLHGTADVLIDHDGHIWAAQDAEGIVRVSIENAESRKPLFHERFTSSDGLTSDLTHALLQDRRGDIWVGTEMGIDRFRPRMFQPVDSFTFEFYPAIATALDGSIWIKESNRELLHEVNGELRVVGPVRGITPLAADRLGGVWLIDPWDHFLHQYDERGLEHSKFALPANLKDTAAQSIIVRADDSLLVAFENHGLWSFSGYWRPYDDPRIPKETPTELMQDGDSTWIGYFDNRLVCLKSSSLKLFGPSDGLNVDTVLVVAPKGNSVWVGGPNGVNFLKDGRFYPLHLRFPEVARGVSGIEFDNHGNLWLNSGFGAMRLRASEVDHVLKDPAYTAIAVVYGSADGVIGIPAQVKPLPTLVKDEDGRLWFATAGNLVRVSPDQLSEPRPTPSLDIQSVRVNGIPVTLSFSETKPLTLVNGEENRIEFEYAAIDLDKPTHITYRYWLEGEDKVWQSAGPSRQAVYGRLSPGTYRFHLAATNGEDKWSELISPFVFVVEPTFYQTIWFLSICVIGGLFGLWVVYLLRMQHVASRIRDRLEQRTKERLRIARELHDTLLQSIHGLMLRFHYAAEALKPDDPARPLLKIALQRADALIVEGRSRVQDLRGEADTTRTLAEMLAQAAIDLVPQGQPSIRITQEGQPHPLRQVVQEEVLRICQEALVNSVRHADASHIGIEIIYGRGFFEVRCHDDGKGIPEDVMESAGRKGHWGLQGMSERAKAIGARFEMWSTENRGTEIEVRMRAAAAYERRNILGKYFDRGH